MTAVELSVRAGGLTLAQLRQAEAGPVRLVLGADDRESIVAARAALERSLAAGRVTYGVNTGFGRLAQTRISAEKLGALQRNLLLSHACGVGAPLDEATVRLTLLLKVNALAQGYSGVRLEVVRQLQAFLERRVTPVVPAQGSVGASGDLAPLAHLCLPLIGEGRAWVDGEELDGVAALARAGLAPLTLEAKEGLALLNGTQVSTALALTGLFDAERNAAAALVAGALAVEAARGSRVPFDARIHAVRGQPGQVAAAAVYRQLLQESDIGRSHAGCGRVQDPYSLRCQPQVMGACLDQMRSVAGVLAREANAVSDNPLIFRSATDDGDAEVLSGGNFHGEGVALAADSLALAVAEMGALSERRIALLIDPAFSQLSPFLVADPGLNSGFMVAQVTAAALASENKSLAHPASVDSLPTSANQEDHVSMATFAARRLRPMNDNTRRIVAIELLAAAQGIELLRPLSSSAPLEEAIAKIRAAVPPWEHDRLFAPDIETIAQEIAGGTFGKLVNGYVDGG